MSFSTALTGLHGAQAEIATTSNNIANIGTTGFKRSTAEFGDIFSTSPSQAPKFAIGSGTLLKSIKQEFSQGNLATSGSTLDIAITGQGFFTLKPSLTSAQTIYSRSGSFTVNSDLYVVDSQAQLLQVYPVNSDGSVVSTGMSSSKSLQLPASSGLPAATNSIEMAINLPSDSKVIPANTPFDKTNPATFNQSSSLTIYDSLGNPSVATIYYVKTKNADEVSPRNKWQTHVFVGDTEIKPQSLKSKNSQGEAFYINQFGQISTAAQVADKLSIKDVGPLYRVDEQQNKQISQPASVTGVAIDPLLFDSNNKIKIVTDPALYKTTHEFDPNSNTFWGVDMFTVDVDGSGPASVSVNPGYYTPSELAVELTRAVNSKFDDPGEFTIRDTVRKDGSNVVSGGNDIIQIDLLKADSGAFISLDNPIEIDLVGSSGSVGTPTNVESELSIRLSREQLVQVTQQKLNDALSERRGEFQKPSNWPDPAHPPIAVGYDVEKRALTFKVDPEQLGEFSTFKVFNPANSLNSLGVPTRSSSPSALIRSDTLWTGSEAVPGESINPVVERIGISVTYDEATQRFKFSSGSTGLDSSIVVGRSQLSANPQPQIFSYDLDQVVKDETFNDAHTVSFDVDGRVLNYDFVPPLTNMDTLDPITNSSAFFDGLAQAAPVNFKQEGVLVGDSIDNTIKALRPDGKLMNGDAFELTIVPAEGADAVALPVGPLNFETTDTPIIRLTKLNAAVNTALGAWCSNYNLSRPTAQHINLASTVTPANQLQFSWTTSDLALPVSMKQTLRGTDSSLVRVNFRNEAEVKAGSSAVNDFLALKAADQLNDGDTFNLAIVPSGATDPVTIAIGPLVIPAGATASESQQILKTALNSSVSAYNSQHPTTPIDYEKRSVVATGDLMDGDTFKVALAPSAGMSPVALDVGPLVIPAGKTNAERLDILKSAINTSINDYNVLNPGQMIDASCTNTGKNLYFDWSSAGMINSPVSLYQIFGEDSRVLKPVAIADRTVVASQPMIEPGSSSTATIQTLALSNPGGSSAVLQENDVYRISLPRLDGTEFSTDIKITQSMLSALNSGAKTFAVMVQDPVTGQNAVNLNFSRGAAGVSVSGTWQQHGAFLGAMSFDQIKVAGVGARPVDIGPLSIGQSLNSVEVSGSPTGDEFRLKVRMDGVLLKNGAVRPGAMIGSAPPTPDFVNSNDLLGIMAGKGEGKGSGLRSTPAIAVGGRAITPMNMTFTPDLTKKENEITVSVDGVVGTIILPIGPYNGGTLAAALQQRINEFEDPKTGHKINGVTVKFDDVNNRLIFTSGSTGPGAQINVLGPSNYGLKNVTQTSGATPSWTQLKQATNAAGDKLYVDANGVITTGGGPVDESKWYPLYLDEGELTFDTFGKIVSPLEAINYSPLALGNGAAPLDLKIDFGKTSTQFNSAFSVLSLSQDGYTSGSMSGLDIDASGTVRVSYSNGQTKALGKIMLATFANVNGLQQVGNADYLSTAVSGEARMGQGGSGGFGTIKSGALEQSNVDVTDELVRLITSQRNFQASAKMIDTQKQLTETLIQIR